MITSVIQEIVSYCGLAITGSEPVSGGDINQCYCLHTKTDHYFLKLNDAKRFPAMFEKEAGGLEALREIGMVTVPSVIRHGVLHDKQWLLLEWINKGSPTKNSLKDFGTELANMHQQPQKFFGWTTDNFIGSLQQLNTQHNSWAEFYTRCRIMPLVTILFNTGSLTKADTENATSFCKKIADQFPEEPPALLHGDLWAGNYLVNGVGKAVLFDPAVYCGHREMDLGMTVLFGGFNQQFYDGYQDTYPLQPGWQQRFPLTQLYPLLVHAVLFGGHYVASVKETLRKC